MIRVRVDWEEIPTIEDNVHLVNTWNSGEGVEVNFETLWHWVIRREEEMGEGEGGRLSFTCKLNILNNFLFPKTS